jgi:hypothetical protein
METVIADDASTRQQLAAWMRARSALPNTDPGAHRRPYLRTELYPGDPAWQTACDTLTASPDPLGRVESQ